MYTDIIDNSGLIFTYEENPREHKAGVMVVGHEIDYKMVIPPNAPNFTVTSVCSDSCTAQVPVLCMANTFYFDTQIEFPNWRNSCDRKHASYSLYW